MNFLESHAIAIRGREQELLGALLLAGLREPDEPLLTEDVLPLELLVVRIGTAREHQLLLRRLLQAERIAGLGQLAGGVAHELNNPLTVVTGYAELMSDSEGSTREHALVILNEARRMKQIIESLIRFRKATPGNRIPVSIEMLLYDIDKLARHDIEVAHIALQMRVPPNLPYVNADGDQLRQVFLHVVKNAVGSMHDTPEGDRRLIIEALPAGPHVQITFSDSGPGFVDPSRAFDPFYTTRHQGEGMGLGLSICYSIIREHGGEISAVNLLPRGAAVVIELAIAAPEPPSIPLPDLNASPATP
jgi:signal transduction histidine kinase